MVKIGTEYEVKDRSMYIKDERKWYYTRVFNEPLEDKDLDCYAKLTYVILSKFADVDKKLCWPSRNTLAKQVGCSKPIIDRSLNKLIEKGYITKHKRPKEDNDNDSNVYVLKDLHPNKTNVHPGKQDLLGSKQDLPPLVNTVNHPGKQDLPKQELFNKNHNNNNILSDSNEPDDIYSQLDKEKELFKNYIEIYKSKNKTGKITDSRHYNLLLELFNIYNEMKFTFDGETYELDKHIFREGITDIINRNVDSLNYAKRVWISHIQDKEQEKVQAIRKEEKRKKIDEEQSENARIMMERYGVK